MPYHIRTSSRYQKSLRKLKMGGHLKLETLSDIVNSLAQRKRLDPKYHDHPLRGDLAHLRECHVQPDMLLLYEIHEQELILLLINIGSHSQLFR